MMIKFLIFHYISLTSLQVYQENQIIRFFLQLFLGESEKSTNHGCATFYHSKLFKEIMKYEVKKL